MSKHARALVVGLLLACATPAGFAGTPMTDADLAAVSGAGPMDPMYRMMANMMVVMSEIPVVGPIHHDMMSIMNRMPVLGSLHQHVMGHATIGQGPMGHPM